MKEKDDTLDLDTEFVNAFDGIKKEYDELNHNLQKFQQAYVDDPGSEHTEKKVHKLFGGCVKHKKQYLITWERINQIFVHLSDFFEMEYIRIDDTLSKIQGKIEKLKLCKQEVKEARGIDEKLLDYLKKLKDILTILKETFAAPPKNNQDPNSNQYPQLLKNPQDWKTKVAQLREKLLKISDRIVNTKIKIKNFGDPS